MPRKRDDNRYDKHISVVTDLISGHDRRTEKEKFTYRDASNLKTSICIPKDAVPERRIECGNTLYNCFTL